MALLKAGLGPFLVREVARALKAKCTARLMPRASIRLLVRKSLSDRLADFRTDIHRNPTTVTEERRTERPNARPARWRRLGRRVVQTVAGTGIAWLVGCTLPPMAGVATNDQSASGVGLTAVSADLERDWLALIAFYKSTDGDNWRQQRQLVP